MKLEEKREEEGIKLGKESRTANTMQSTCTYSSESLVVMDTYVCSCFNQLLNTFCMTVCVCVCVCVCRREGCSFFKLIHVCKVVAVTYPFLAARWSAVMPTLS